MNTSESLALLKTALGAPNEALTNALGKSYAQSSGLVAYDLQAPSLKLYPVLTPLRNRLPRVGGGIGTATHWKAVTAINPSKFSAGVSEGNRGAFIDQTVADYLASYKGFGLENYVTFEADYAGRGFEDVKATAALQTLQATMVAEESAIFGGNTSLNLNTTPTPTVTPSNSGGALSAATWSVICVALTHAGYQRASVTGGVVASVTKTNADGTTDTFGGGAAQKSANATGATTGSTGSLTASVTPVLGAVAYAWYVGTAGAEKLAAITTINSVAITAAPAGGNQAASALPSADNSTNSLTFDGLLTVASQSSIFGVANGAYQKSLATGTAGVGTGFSSDGAGGIKEFTTAFQYFWDNYRVSPDEILVSAQEAINITQCVVKNGGVPLVHYLLDATNQSVGGAITSGVLLKAILNPITQEWIKLTIHPNATAGTVVFVRFGALPYPLNGVGNVMQMRLRQDYYQLEWPVTKRRYEYGVYCDGVFQHYAPFTLGVINNIGNLFT